MFEGIFEKITGKKLVDSVKYDELVFNNNRLEEKKEQVRLLDENFRALYGLAEKDIRILKERLNSRDIMIKDLTEKNEELKTYSFYNLSDSQIKKIIRVTDDGIYRKNMRPQLAFVRAANRVLNGDNSREIKHFDVKV